jgi:hypothetical protein
MGGHQSARMIKDEWLTPPEIIHSLGEFDLDPCSPIDRPWDTAKNHYNILDDGLSKEWNGRVWLNPPYGKEASKWLEKLSIHNNGIALIFARTEITPIAPRLINGITWSSLPLYTSSSSPQASINFAIKDISPLASFVAQILGCFASSL